MRVLDATEVDDVDGSGERGVLPHAGHLFGVLTQTCSCGMTIARFAEGTPRNPAPSHDDMLNPGTVEATYRQRSTGHTITYRKPK